MHIFKTILLFGFLLLISINPTSAAGSVTVYDFGASWCAPCRADIARDNELSAAYGGAVTFVFVDEDVDQAKADAFISSTGPSFSVKYDPDHSFAKSMGAGESAPSLVIVGGGSNEVIHGSISKDALKARIDAKLGTPA